MSGLYGANICKHFQATVPAEWQSSAAIRSLVVPLGLLYELVVFHVVDQQSTGQDSVHTSKWPSIQLCCSKLLPSILLTRKHALFLSSIQSMFTAGFSILPGSVSSSHFGHGTPSHLSSTMSSRRTSTLLRRRYPTRISSPL